MTSETEKPSDRTDEGVIKTKHRPRRRQLLWFGLAAFLAALYGGYRWVATPHVNPNPTKKVVVHGTFPYDRGWELRIERESYTKNPLCKVTSRVFLIFSEAEVSREYWISIPVTREGENRYSFSFFDDHFLPGLCEWQERFTYYSIFDNGRPIIRGDAILGLNRLYNKLNYRCHFIEMPRTNERRVSCLRGNDHSFDSERKDNEVNFIWEGEEQ